MAAPVVASVTSAINQTTVAKPSGVVAGDLLVVIAMSYDANDIPVTLTGFTQRGRASYNVSNKTTVNVLDRVADGSEASTFTLGFPNGFTYTDLFCLRVTGATASPFDVAATNAGSGTAVTANGVTTTAADDLILLAHGGYGAALSATYSGFTQQGLIDSVNYVFSKGQATAGATGNFAATQASSDTWAVVTVAYKSASAPTGGPQALAGTAKAAARASGALSVQAGIATVAASGTVNIGTSASGGVAVNMPAGVTAGDLLLVFVSHDTSNAVTASAGWTSIATAVNSTGLIIFAKIAAGGDTCTITGTANDYVIQSVRVAGHGVANVSTDIAVSTSASGTSATADPPALTPAAGSRNWLWFAACAIDMTATTNTLTAAPSGYTSITLTKSVPAGSTTSCALGVAYKPSLATTTEDPGGFTNTSRAWVARTLAIPPVGGAQAVAGAARAASRGKGSLDVVPFPRFSEAFTGTDGAAWSAQRWAVTASSGSSASIQGSKGRLATGAVGGYADWVVATAADLGLANVEIRGHVTDFVAGENYPALIFRSDGAFTGGQPNNAFVLSIDPVGSGSIVELFRTVAGVRTNMLSTPLSLTTGETCHMRVVCNGSTVDVYVWKNNTLEPTPPTWSFTDSWHTTRTRMAVAEYGGNAAGSRTVSFENVTAVPILPAPTTSLTASQMYWGAWIGTQFGGQPPFDMTSVTDFEAVVGGKKLSLIQFSTPFADYVPTTHTFYGFDSTAADNIRNYGAIPFFSWGSRANPNGTSDPDFALANVIRGDFDSYITSWATQAAAWGHPFFLRFNHEQNGNWFSWSESVNGNQPGEFVAAWRHVHDLVAPIATNAVWVWCPTFDPIGQFQDIAVTYPGDAYVDWTSIDAYNHGAPWYTFAETLRNTYNRILQLAPNKPMILAEVAGSETGGTKSTWVTDMLTTQLNANFPAVKGFLWFEFVDSTYHWEIESSTASQTAFTNAIASPSYLPNNYASISTIPLPGQTQALAAAAKTASRAAGSLTVTAAGYRGYTLGKSPTAYWRQGDTGSVVADEVGAFNGTYVGTVSKGIFSPVDNANARGVITTGGGSAYGRVASVTATSPASLRANVWTFRTWVRIRDTSSDFYVYTRSDGTGNVLLRLTPQSGEMRPQMIANWTTVCTATSGIADAYKWHQLVVVSSGTLSSTSELKFYLDGTLLTNGTFTAPTGVTGTTSDVQLGAAFGEAVQAETAIFPAAWTATDVANDYTAATLNYLPNAAQVTYGLHDDMVYEGSSTVRQTVFANGHTDGSRVSRNTVLWELVEPTNGAIYDWSRHDAVLTEMAAAGIEPLMVIAGTPTWANGGATRWSIPTDPTAFTALVTRMQTFVADLVNRYKTASGGRPRVARWEIWNEPNLSTSWNPTPSAAQYTQLANALIGTILTADPTAKVGVGALSGYGAAGSPSIAGVTFLNSVLDTGLDSRANVFSIHPYNSTRAPASQQNFDNNFTDVQRLLDTLYGRGRVDANTRVWMTEYGWDSTLVTDATQASYLGAAFAIVDGYWSHWVDTSIIFSSFSDSSGERSGYGIRGNAPTFPEKPAAAVLRAEQPPAGVAQALAGTAKAAARAAGATAVARPLGATARAAARGTGVAAGAKPLTSTGRAAARATGTVAVLRGASGVSQAAARAAGSLNATRPLAAVARTAARAAAAVTTTSGHDLTGSTGAASRATGSVTVTHPLAAVARSAARGTAGLGVARPLTSTARAGARATATPTVVRTLTGAAKTAARAAGSLAVGRSFAAVARAASKATGGVVVTAQSDLTGTVRAAARATGTLSGVVQAAGTARNASKATGGLAVARPLAGAARATGRATGGITATRPLNATATASARVTALARVERGLTASSSAAGRARGLLFVGAGQPQTTTRTRVTTTRPPSHATSTRPVHAAATRPISAHTTTRNAT